METDSPIFVTGVPRSGTTFLQHLLSVHERIDILGQEPRDVRWGYWLKALRDGIGSAERSNSAIGYASPHYAAAGGLASDVTREFLTLIKNYLQGGRVSARWGVKSLTTCRECPDGVLEVWPATRWIVCVRDPRRSITSLRNTFDLTQRLSTAELLEMWRDAALFGLHHPAARIFQIDELEDTSQREAATRELFGFIGEDYTPTVRRFVAEWPVIHKVVSDDARQETLNVAEFERIVAADRTLHDLLSSLGYL